MKILLQFLSLTVLLAPYSSEACTRATYLSSNGSVVTGRTMDWAEDIQTNLYFFPKGMARVGEKGPSALKWTSKYASLVGTAYDLATVDGVNEKGLAANLLYLADSDYGVDEGKRTIVSIAAWAQYVLDSFATVSEAVDALMQANLQIIAPNLPNGIASLGHLALSDQSGDSAIFEYIDGKMVIHRGKEYQVMTNSPTFEQQLAIDKYWKEIGGLVMLPGTNRASDRFVRASFYIKAIPQNLQGVDAVAALLSVMSNASVPLGISTPGKPNIASTLWRSAIDQNELVYYFSSTQSPYIFWVPLADLKNGSSVKKLTLTGGEIYGGNAAAQFKTAPPFSFLQ